MSKKRRMNKFLSGFLVTVLLVSLNINPVAVIIQGIVDSGIVDRFHNLKENLVALADGSLDTVFADEATPTPTPVNVTVNCDHTAEINKLMGYGGVTLTDINNNITSKATLINGTISSAANGINSNLNDIEAQLVNVNSTLKTISSQLAAIQGSIQAQQHEYRVAHLYSLNNAFSSALWRPSTEDVPYVEDFAIVQGKFANVYSGYWNSSIPTSSNPGGAAVSRALQVLGYDAMVRYEGVILQTSVSPIGTSQGGSGLSTTYGNLNPGAPGYTIATLDQEMIGTNGVTWLDAVTLLYKAMGQYQFTYQSFMSHDRSITPETSPAFQGLSNPVITTVENDAYYQGYQFNVFLTRSNVLSGTAEKVSPTAIYWTKAIGDQVIPVGVTADTEITGRQFLKLAHRIMVAYGEPEMTMDETMALLQVYGTNFPISLGIDTADAWAYLKVRGCLADNVMSNLSSTMTVEELLDICMRIKDKDSRLDYKNIDIVLDIGELMRDDGYYPVYDLEFTSGDFTSSISYDYSVSTTYEYFLCTQDTNSPQTGSAVILSKPDITAVIEGAQCISQNFEIDRYKGILISVPKTYKGDIYIGFKDFVTGSQVTSDCNYICVPASLLGGGAYIGSVSKATPGVAMYTSDSYNIFDTWPVNKELARYADFSRAGEQRPVVTASADSTFLGKVLLAFDSWTSPMTVNAAPGPDVGYNTYAICLEGSGTAPAPTKNKDTNTGTNNGNLDDSVASVSGARTGNYRQIDKLTYVESDDILKYYPQSEPGKYEYDIDSLFLVNGSPVSVNVASDTGTILLNRLYLLGQYETARNAMGADTSKGFFSYNEVDPDDYDENFGAIERTYTYGQILARMYNDTCFNDNGRLRICGWGSGADMVQEFEDDRAFSDGYPAIKYNATYGDFMIRYLLAAAPGASITSDKSSGTSAGFGTDVPHSMMTGVEKDVSENATAWDYKDGRSWPAKGFSTWAKSMFGEGKDNEHTKIEDAIKGLVLNDGLSGSQYDSATGEYKFSFTKEDGSSNLSNVLGGLSDSPFVNVDATLATSAVMSRKEEQLLSWTSLVRAGVVYNGINNEKPTANNEGVYYFSTVNGQVKVNTNLCTIQVGTTLYDLMPSNGSAPKLVYYDNDQHELYIDVRCIMGTVGNTIFRNEEQTTILKNSLGSGNVVVYDIGVNGVSSPMWKVTEVNSYNFAAVPGTGGLCTQPALQGSYTMNVILSTVYDGKYNISDGVPYWGEDKASAKTRLSLASFCPTANWIVVIDDPRDENGTGDPLTASLYVYYPKEPFESGFANSDDGSLATVHPPEDLSQFDNYQTVVNKASERAPAGDSKTLAEALEAAYGSSDEWYIKMSKMALASLYEKTGRYYISGDFVVREFRIENNNFRTVSAWDSYSWNTDENSKVEHLTDAKVSSITSNVYSKAANATGAVYWLEGIGFVYNMPTVDEFTLEKYLAGVYPLPLAYNNTNAYGYKDMCIVNYNMNYWGNAQNKSGNTIKKVPYGYSLSEKGYVHYSGNHSVLAGCGIDSLPVSDDKADSKWLPFDEDKVRLAPTGIYYSFGGNPYEVQKAGSTTQYMTTQNQFYWGGTRVVLSSTGDGTNYLYNYVSYKYNHLSLDSIIEFNRVYSSKKQDVLVYNGNVNVAATSLVSTVTIDDYALGQIENPLDRLGATDLLTAIDEGASFAIIFSFNVFPIIGFLIMMLLIALSFVGENSVVQKLCDKFDPVRFLTFGHRNITTWTWNKVLIPCTLLLCMFAVFYNGNLIRIVQWCFEWYSTIMRYSKNL